MVNPPLSNCYITQIQKPNEVGLFHTLTILSVTFGPLFFIMHCTYCLPILLALPQYTIIKIFLAYCGEIIIALTLSGFTLSEIRSTNV